MEIPEPSPQRVVRRALSIDETAETLGVSHWTVRRLIKSGALRSCRVLRTHLVPVSEIDRLLGDESAGSKK